MKVAILLVFGGLALVAMSIEHASLTQRVQTCEAKVSGQ